MLSALASETPSLGRFVLETVGVLALLAVAAWLAVRLLGPRMRSGRRRRLRVVERLALEPRRSLYVVEVDGLPYLLGVADGSVRLLQRLDPPAPEPPAPPDDGEDE
ncbi:MAG: flagellar biosynthetic protein FliO [Polyangia bacterium]